MRCEGMGLLLSRGLLSTDKQLRQLFVRPNHSLQTLQTCSEATLHPAAIGRRDFADNADKADFHKHEESLRDCGDFLAMPGD